jgi:hypothetical protein
MHKSVLLVQCEGEEEPIRMVSVNTVPRPMVSAFLDRTVVAPAEDAAMEVEANSEVDTLLVVEDTEAELNIGVNVLSIVYLGSEG